MAKRFPKGNFPRRPTGRPVKRERLVLTDANKEAFTRQAEEAVRISFLGGISRFKNRLPKAKLDAMFNEGGYDALRTRIPWQDLPKDMAPASRELGKLMTRTQRHVDAIGRDEVKGDYMKDATNPRAAELTKDRMGKYLQDLTDEGNAHVHDVVAEHQRTGKSPKSLADDIKGGIGLNKRQRFALANAENKDIESGKFTPAQVAKRKKAYEARLLDQRATMIAVTETRVVANNSETLAWQAQAEDGILDPESKRVWATEPDCCDVCVQLSGVAVGLYQEWVLPDGRSFPYPPAHPNCRCTTFLLAPGES